MLIYDVNPATAYEIAKEKWNGNVRKIILPDGRYDNKNTPRGKFIEKISGFDVIVKISSKSQGKARVYCSKDDYKAIEKILLEIERS